jgi:hypothetical protein
VRAVEKGSRGSERGGFTKADREFFLHWETLAARAQRCSNCALSLDMHCCFSMREEARLLVILW